MESFDLRDGKQPKVELKMLVDEDQEDREKRLGTVDPKLFSEKERARHQKALDIFAQYGKILKTFLPKTCTT